MNTKTIAVLYHSVTGTTHRLAQAVCEGVASVAGSQARALRISGRDIHEGRYRNDDVLAQLCRADAIIFGSPTFLGNVSAQFKAFADASSAFWPSQRWAGKPAGGFTVGLNPSGDQLNTIQYLSILAAQHGMLWVGLDLPGSIADEPPNPMGAQSGVIARAGKGGMGIEHLRTAAYLGARIAALTVALGSTTANGGTRRPAPASRAADA